MGETMIISSQAHTHRHALTELNSVFHKYDAEISIFQRIEEQRKKTHITKIICQKNIKHKEMTENIDPCLETKYFSQERCENFHFLFLHSSLQSDFFSSVWKVRRGERGSSYARSAEDSFGLAILHISTVSYLDKIR